jgi:tryptophan halogenase
VKRVVILGGGTAGWMSAAYLAKALGSTTEITLLEAPAIPRLGVGEATIPNLQTVFFDFLGIPESEWMPECGASYKMAVKFINWRTPGTVSLTPRQTNGHPDRFYHIFGLLPYHDGLPLSQYWVHKYHNSANRIPFDYACYRSAPLMDAKQGPKHWDGTPVAPYAWHFDAQRVADFLCRFATHKQHVHHVQGEMEEVHVDDRGFITGLSTKDGRLLTGDLFVDCSGFRGLLINKALGEPFVDMSDHLLCNSAVATTVPGNEDVEGVEPYTSSVAMDAGWVWKIPMPGRIGTGYVYSNQHSTQDEATEDLCRIWNLDPSDAPLNHLRFRVGRNRRAWVKNCVSIGASSCFVEPLESSGIYFTYAALYQLAQHWPDMGFSEVLRDSFNREIETMFDDTRDFLQAHFYFSPRTDTEFWRDNKALALAAPIREKIELYRAGMPINPPASDDPNQYYNSFEAVFRNFWTNCNYYCVLAGLGCLPDQPLPRLAHMGGSVESAEQVFGEIERDQRSLLESVPTTLELLRHEYGA